MRRNNLQMFHKTKEKKSEVDSDINELQTVSSENIVVMPPL